MRDWKLLVVVCLSLARPVAAAAEVVTLDLPQFCGRYSVDQGERSIALSELSLPEDFDEPRIRLSVASTNGIWYRVDNGDTLVVEEPSSLVSFVHIEFLAQVQAADEFEQGVHSASLAYSHLGLRCPDWSCFTNTDAVLLLSWDPRYIFEGWTRALTGEINVLSASLEFEVRDVPTEATSWSRVKALY